MTLPHPRFALFLIVFLAVSGLALARLPPEGAVILGFDLGALGFLASIVPLWREQDAVGARARAARDDGGRILLVMTAGLVILAILMALGIMVGGRQALGLGDFVVVTGTLVLAWLFSNMVYALHYAHLYYDQKDDADVGGIQLPGGGMPTFSDFVYFAFTIGMTCQTADIDITSPRVRRVATLQALIAFFFNLGVLAMTINVLSGVL